MLSLYATKKKKKITFFSPFYLFSWFSKLYFAAFEELIFFYSELCVVVIDLKNVGCGIEVLIGVAYIAMRIVTLLINALLLLTLLRGINLCTTKTKLLLSLYVSLCHYKIIYVHFFGEYSFY